MFESGYELFPELAAGNPELPGELAAAWDDLGSAAGEVGGESVYQRVTLAEWYRRS